MESVKKPLSAAEIHKSIQKKRESEREKNRESRFRNITNNIAMELFGNGTATRGISSSASTQVSTAVTIPLKNIAQIVNFEVGQLLVASATDGGAPSSDTVTVTGVDRANGIVKGTASTTSLSANCALS